MGTPAFCNGERLMDPIRFVVTIAICAGLCAPAAGDVVINEILYHAPDDLDNLQFIELHNPGDAAIDLAGWKLGRNIRYEFPAEKRIEAGGYLVLCKDAALFKKYYGFDADGVFTGALGHGGDRIDLLDSQGRRMDSV